MLLLAALLIGVSTVVQSVNICDQCLCDDLQPYLIDCSQKGLTHHFAEDDWTETLTLKNISSETGLDVRFDNNKIKRVKRFPELNIESLSFMKNSIDTVENSAFADLKTLKTLDLSHNQLDANGLPELALYGIFNSSEYYYPLPVMYLSLSHNNLHSIDKDLFDHLPYLQTLDLSYNPLTVLGSTSQAISSLRNLQVLDLANTQLKNIPEGMLHDLKHLQSLSLANNHFTSVPHEISNSHNLTVLDLDGNKFETLDHTSFMGLDNLTELHISHMATLKVIESRTFGSLKKLRVLQCHHNRKLRRLSDGAFMGITEDPQHWPVQELYLNDNGLTVIDKALASWTYVEIIDMQGNPFNCNCDIQWMAEDLVTQIEQTTPALLTNIRCATPESMRDRLISTLSYEHEEFIPCMTGSKNLNGDYVIPSYRYQATGIIILSIGVILIVIGLSIITVIVVKRRAIAHALMAHQQIRYERADTDEEEFRDSYSPYHINRKV